MTIFLPEYKIVKPQARKRESAWLLLVMFALFAIVFSDLPAAVLLRVWSN